MAAPRSIVGAHVRVYKDKDLIGYAVDLEAEENAQLSRVDVLGNLYSEEIVDSGIVVSGRLRLVILKDEKLRARGVDMGRSTQEILAEDYFDLHAYNHVDQTVIFTIRNCKFERKSFTFNARQVVMSDVGFQGISMSEPR